MELSLKGYTALITGGSKGIGEATAMKMAQMSARIAVLARGLPLAQEVASKIVAAGGEAMAVSADVAIKEQVDKAVLSVVEKFGSVDILVNNAGYTEAHPFVDETEAYWDKLIGINLKGTFFATQAALKYMIDKKFGRIINVASDSGRTGNPGEVVYGATKAAVMLFTKALAREVARYGINVNCVSPGPTNTDLMKDQPEKMIEGLKKLIPLRRIGEPRELADVIAFFCSKESDYITGQVLSVSGGLTMVG